MEYFCWSFSHLEKTDLIQNKVQHWHLSAKVSYQYQRPDTLKTLYKTSRNGSVLMKKYGLHLSKITNSIKRHAQFFHHSIRKAVCLVQRQNLLFQTLCLSIQLPECNILALVPEFVALCTTSFCSHCIHTHNHLLWETPH